MFSNELFMLGADLVPKWVSDSFPTIRAILMAILLVLAAGIIITILLQESGSSGMGAMAGQNTETFYSKHKGRSLQGLLKRLTVIFSISILVVTVLYLISVLIFPV